MSSDSATSSSKEKITKSPSATSGLSTRFDFEDDFVELENNGLELQLTESSGSLSESDTSEQSSSSTVPEEASENKRSLWTRFKDKCFMFIVAANLIAGCVLINISTSWLYCQYHLDDPLCEYFRPDFKGRKG
ncbi:Oidioi.mRNA.OKI2018_I69.chr2.g6289.t1.cds [Oikopleura dioica]|uniref:Oidioi.mRNA.OKI2018_I69.chr2.g6289.t1.cds n=1 Tax=Oikopleura dioica TaxID=34765 RepID=A0ABN7T908_OIKDI|nr:Oidioi.mRNA.OKI2018_I69.chr2.g6289.t1.cds [Oikopleura dioica]